MSSEQVSGGNGSSVGAGVTADLFDPMLHCVLPDEPFVEYGIVEYRLAAVPRAVPHTHRRARPRHVAAKPCDGLELAVRTHARAAGRERPADEGLRQGDGCVELQRPDHLLDTSRCIGESETDLGAVLPDDRTAGRLDV